MSTKLDSYKKAVGILASHSALRVYDIYVPSMGRNIQFKEMTIGQQKSMSKTAFEGDAKLSTFLSTLIYELSDTEVTPDLINEVDKTIILFGIRFKNNQEPPKFTSGCMHCGAKVTHTFDSHELNSTSITFNESVKTFKFHDMDIACHVSLPSVAVIDSYNEYVVARDGITKQDDISMASLRAIEQTMLMIRKVVVSKIEGDTEVLLDELLIHERLEFLSMLPSECFAIESFIDMKNSQEKSISYESICGNCDGKTINYLTPTSFFL